MRLEQEKKELMLKSTELFFELIEAIKKKVGEERQDNSETKEQ